MYRLISRIYPKNIKKMLYDLFSYVNIKVDPDKFIGFVLFFCFGLALTFSLLIGRLVNVPFLVLLFFFFILFLLMVYFYITLRIDAKARFIEELLPDALQLMSSNLRAGYTTDKALLLSARPEFGPLRDEINRVGKEITMGKDIDEALLEMTKNVRSKKLKKTIMLIVTGIKSGGELASLLDQTAKNLRQEKFVEEKIRSNVMMYVVFISSAIGFGAPLLFGLSSFLVEVLTTNIAAIEIPQTTVASAMPIKFSTVGITIGFVKMYSIVSLVTSSVLGSFILGLIGKGEEKRGIKYIPILILMSLSMFFFVRFVIKNMLGGLF